MEQVGDFVAQGLFKREYRDHRLEWMMRSGGVDVVTESLRRICIWRAYGQDDGIGAAWWDYVEEFMYRCDNPDKPGFFNNGDCIADVMNVAGVDKAK